MPIKHLVTGASVYIWVKKTTVPEKKGVQTVKVHPNQPHNKNTKANKGNIISILKIL